MARGGYTFEQIRQMSQMEVMFLYYYQDLAIKEQQKYLTNILGIIWNRNTLVQQTSESSGESKPINELFIPLSLAINPEVLDFIKTQFGMGKDGVAPGGEVNKAYIGGGEYQPKKGEVIKSMSEMSKEDFMKLLGKKSSNQRSRK
jgi:hypothetical protein